MTVAVALDDGTSPSGVPISAEVNCTLYVVVLVTVGTLNLYVTIPLVLFSALEKATFVPLATPPETLTNVKPPSDVTSMAP